ncbi:MAG: hypothetical protein H6686_02655 [Fibrobacteria bacterium]|nr:hypothetical protein [Fibrobacteria bacterium]
MDPVDSKPYQPSNGNPASILVADQRDAARAARCLAIAGRILAPARMRSLQHEVAEGLHTRRFRFTKRHGGVRMDPYDVGEDVEAYLQQVQVGEDEFRGTVWFRLTPRHFLAWDFIA